jgi:hypothetical protein
LVWYDLNDRVAFKRTQNGDKETARLELGEANFAIAKFTDGVVVTTIPNLLIQKYTPPKDGGKKAKTTKTDAKPKDKVEGTTFALMYYKNKKAIGIRRFESGSKKQIISFGGQKCKLEEAALRDIGKTALEKLQSGEAEDDVKLWAVGEANK